MQVHRAKTYKESPRVSLSSCGVPFSLRDQKSRKSVSYNKLPQEPMRINVLKLDGTCFEICVARNGTVVDLKRGVEMAFRHLPKNGPGTVSWSHVWGNFCLSYDGQKLLTDSDSIGDYEIKDGGQIEFVRHVSITYPVKTRSEREDTYMDEARESKGNGDRQPECKEENNHQGKLEYHTIDIDIDEEDCVTVASNYECKSAPSLKRWFSNRRFSRSETRKG
nr:U11/U12 small nuclear ribonucleoprotein 25 kDa protein-like isoform X2 [Ipomoea batatas]